MNRSERFHKPKLKNMNAISVVPKKVVVVPARTAEVATLTWRTVDDAFNRRLRIMVNGSVSLEVVP